ncbi:DMT family transporter [Poseidonocella sedimentorum]|uniref:Uncharacterized membrane protein n=1 Tax=Poseidonocella sedimentorum TaxID=871652 RepID=A0A1I6DVX0_9RHOB|nr:DMT family transporter [Poseidonocella sedimentorum]SFR09639.1 Uncharacterized membrane protein [Poseidonocella sedimentorum]
MTEQARGHLAMLLFSLLVAGSFSLGALAAPLLDPVAFNALRFLLAAIILGAIAAARGKIRAVYYRSLWRYLVLGVLFAAYFALMFEGLRTADPVRASAIFTLTPVMAAGFGWLLMRQRTTRRIALGLALGALGALWVIFRADLAALVRFEIGRGEMVYFIGCVAHAIYTPLVPKLNRGEPVIAFSLGVLIMAFVLLTLIGLPAIVATDWAGLPPVFWISLLYLVVFASAMTFVLMQYAALRLPASKVMAYTYIVPSWVIGWELALRHGGPTPLVIVGILVTVGALLLMLKE